MAGLEYEDERQAIEGQVEAGWAALGDPIQVGYSNVRFQEPAPVKNVCWMRLTIINGETFQQSLGPNPCHRAPGQIVAQLFVPEESGTNDIRIRADQFIAMFLSATGQPLEFSAGNSGRIRTELGRMITDGITNGWLQVRAIVPFVRDIQL